jgi:hypothetical protein
MTASRVKMEIWYFVMHGIPFETPCTGGFLILEKNNRYMYKRGKRLFKI